MTKKIRLSILLACIICFFAAAPLLVAYSMGYRFDFEENKVVSTGGIYVRTFPPAEQIVIDSKIRAKPGIFSNAIFVQSLLPKNHTVSIQKSGYYDYFKTLPVQKRTVTKLENVTLFKKSLTFSHILDKVDYFALAPDGHNAVAASEGAKIITLNYFNLNENGGHQEVTIAEAGLPAQTGKILDIRWAENSIASLIKVQISSDIFYYFFDGSLQTPTATRLPYLDKNSNQISFNPKDNQEIFYEENETLYSLKNRRPKTVIKNLLTYAFSANNILWLSSEGGLYESDASGTLLNTLTMEDKDIGRDKKYKMIIVSGKIFLQQNSSLFLFNESAKTFEKFSIPEGNYEILNSPDNKNFIFCGGDKIFVHSFTEQKNPENAAEVIFSGSIITKCQWLNNDYVIFTTRDKIIISETDYRGNINAVTLSSTLDLGEKKIIAINNPQTSYIMQSGKLYVLSNNTLAVSEKITP